MEKKYQDKELGTITIRASERATRYILKVKNGEVIATMPYQGNEKTLWDFLEQNRNKLLKQISQQPKQRWDESTVLQTNTFSLHIFCTDRKNFYLSLKEGILHIACPLHTDFSQNSVQILLNSFLERTLRYEAKRILPARLMALAQQYNFTVNGIKIQNSKSRWGSCSTRKIINLSLHLMLLPPHLIDYVLLHELCHTVEMNHSMRFWKLMDQVTHNQSHQLREELKNFSPLI
ncbi:M48 family metallopeptidase [Parabacteroides pacaensis]|uniref:M48 family metallopeptidase n=1 Tax=Parabacteroides pacaensis TaxID=2086575 RepID=UPI000D1008FC|nr:YgjP-like metallopeptidase domain-containing protein [Parabacteroides pacaensis]